MKVTLVGLWVGALAALTTSAWAECTDWSLAPTKGSSSSEWREHDKSGRLLVAESGTLKTTGLDLSVVCQGWVWIGQLEAASGDRAYLGLSDRNVWLPTSSHIDRQTVGVTMEVPLAERWSLQLGVDGRRVRRNIKSTAQALGYAERFTYLTLKAGVGYSRPLAPGWSMHAKAAVGYLPQGQLAVTLPGADATTLTLGHGRSSEWGLGLRYAPDAASTGWQWTLDWLAQEESVAAGPAKAIYRGSRLIGSASQPATRQRHETFRLAAHYHF